MTVIFSLLGISIIIVLDILRRQSKFTARDEIKFDRNKHWEKVPGGMKRIKIAGGWIYRDCMASRSLAMTFVPDSKKGIITYEDLYK
jgi:hypothetical protein